MESGGCGAPLLFRKMLQITRNANYVLLVETVYQKYVSGVSGMRPGPHFQMTNGHNRPNESNSAEYQSYVSEYSAAGVPASFYNITKSNPNPQLLLQVRILYNSAYRSNSCSL